MRLKNNIFFIGAGGIGMAALERYFLAEGYTIGGYDLTKTPLTEALSKEGVEMNYVGSVESIPQHFRDKENTLVIYTPAVPQSLPCFRWFKDNGFEMLKRSQALGLVTANSQSICIAGTHGKTTTSSIAAHILTQTPHTGCNAFLGGILKNYGSNFLLCKDSNISVIEADEFDRSFHWLRPTVAVITSSDPDHLDIYGTEREYLNAFEHFTSLIKPEGYLIIHTGLNIKPKVDSTVKVYTYSSQGENADFMATDIRHEGRELHFNLHFPNGTVIKDFKLSSPVEINIDNSVAAIASVWVLGKFNESAVKEALRTFKGSERRFDIRWEENKENGRIIIDDYAHHPREVEASIKSIKQMFPNRQVTVAFQPHLYSRTRDFASDFAKALEIADEVILVNLYPAREEPIPGISSHTILNLINKEKKFFVEKENFSKFIKNSNFDVLVTLGAGDLPNYIPDLIASLT